MKSITKLPPMALSLVLALIVSGVVRAEVVLADASQLVGNWKLDHTSPQIDGTKRPSNQTWEFRSDGTLVSTASDPRAKGTFSVTVPYELSDGNIVTGMAGRPGKKVTYSVVEMLGNKMVIKGGPDGYLFFTKQ